MPLSAREMGIGAPAEVKRGLTPEEMGIESPKKREDVISAPQSKWADRRYGVANAIGSAASAIEWLVDNSPQRVGTEAIRKWKGKPSEPSYVEGLSEGAEKAVGNVLGAEKPSTLEGESRAQSIENLLYAAPTLPFVGPAVGAMEVGASVIGPFINKTVQDRFRNNDIRSGSEEGLAGTLAREGAGFGAEMGLAVAAPGMAVTTAKKVPARLKRIKQAFEASPEIRALAKRLDVNVRDLFKESEEIKRLFPKAPDGSESIIQDAIEKARAVVDEFPDPQYRPRTLQAMDNDIARENLSNAESSLGKMPGSTKEWLPEIEGRQVFLEDELQKRFDDMQFEGSAPGLSEDFATGSGNVRREATEKWRDASPSLDQYEFPSEDTRRVAQGLIEDATEYGDMPALITRLANETEKPVHSLREIQAMQSELKAIQRAAKLDPSKAPAANWAGRMLDHLSGLEKSIPDGDVVPVLREARKATARKKDLLANTPANKALRDKDQVREVGFKVVNSREDARRAVEVLKDVDGGMDNLRHVVTEAIWGDELFDKATRISPRRVINLIEKYGDGLEEVFGAEHLERMKKLSRWYEMTERGRMGTVAANRGAGSNQSSAVATLASAAAEVNPSMISPRAILKLISSVESNPKRIRIFQEFFADPETAAQLLELPTDRGKAAWVLGWKKLLARTSARSAVTNDAQNVKDLFGGTTPQGVKK